MYFETIERYAPPLLFTAAMQQLKVFKAPFCMRLCPSMATTIIPLSRKQTLLPPLSLIFFHLFKNDLF
jgi:hypothetical protein